MSKNSQQQVHSMIEQFVSGGAKLRAAVEGVTNEEAQAKPGPGLWSIHELVVHLTDMDAIAIDRMKRVLTEDNPTLLNAQEQAYVERLHCAAQSMDDALLLFEVNRRQFTRVLRKLDADCFLRIGTHDVAGEVSLSQLLTIYTEHLDHHLGFVAAKLERLRA